MEDIIVDQRTIELAKKFWPGALTIISKIKNRYISKIATANLKTLAVRVPSNNTIRNILNQVSFPIAALALIDMEKLVLHVLMTFMKN